MAAPRRNRQATAKILVIVLAATAIALWSLLRDPSPDLPPPAWPGDAAAAQTMATEAAAAATNEREYSSPAGLEAATRDERPHPRTGIVDVRLRFTGGRRQRVRLFVTDDAGAAIAAAERPGDRDEVGAEFTVPAHDWIRVGAVTFDGLDAEAGAGVEQVRTKLGPDERQLVVLECPGVVTPIRLVGPSARLMPHLQIAVHRAPFDAAQDRRPFVVHPDAAGTARCHLPDEPVRAYAVTSENPLVLLTDELGTIDLVQRGGELRLTPAEPLLGIVVEQRGVLVPSTLSLTRPLYRHLPSPCEVTTRRLGEAATFVHGWTDDLGPFRVPIDEVRRAGDLWVVDPGPRHQCGHIVVTVGEPSGPSSNPLLVAEPLGGGAPQRLWRAAGTLRASLAAGDYRLDWERNGGRGPVAAEFVRIVGGATATLHLQPPASQRWQVQLQLPPQCPHAAFLRLSGISSLGTAQNGVVEIDLCSPVRIGDRGELFVPAFAATFDATVAAVDPGQQRAVVASTLTDAVWTRLAAAPMAGGRVRVLLQPAAGSGDLQPAPFDRPTLVPLLPGHPRDGCVIETIDGDEQLVKWFRLQAAEPEKLLTGVGRWTTLQIERPIVRATVLMAGPTSGEPTKVRDVKAAGLHRLFVADDTRAVHVDLEPGGRRTFDASLGAFVVPR